MTTPTSLPIQVTERPTPSIPPRQEKRKRLTVQSDQAAAYQNLEVGSQSVRNYVVECVHTFISQTVSLMACSSYSGLNTLAKTCQEKHNSI